MAQLDLECRAVMQVEAVTGLANSEAVDLGPGLSAEWEVATAGFQVGDLEEEMVEVEMVEEMVEEVMVEG